MRILEFNSLINQDRFDESVNRIFAKRNGFNFFSYPKVDIFETENEVVLNAEVPGLKKDDIKITLEKGTLTLSGEIKNDLDNKNVLRTERFNGTFSRSFNLSDEIDQDTIKAKSENGILTVTLGKKAELKERVIEVNWTPSNLN